MLPSNTRRGRCSLLTTGSKTASNLIRLSLVEPNLCLFIIGKKTTKLHTLAFYSKLNENPVTLHVYRPVSGFKNHFMSTFCVADFVHFQVRRVSEFSYKSLDLLLIMDLFNLFQKPLIPDKPLLYVWREKIN